MATLVKKKWGHELQIQTYRNVRELGYTLKELTVLPNGKACSIHYHVMKTETFYVIKGCLMLEMWSLTTSAKSDWKWFATLPVLYRMPVGSHTTIIPWRPHRFWAEGKKKAVFIEGSSPDSPEDSIRLVEAGPIPSLNPFHSVRKLVPEFA